MKFGRNRRLLRQTMKATGANKVFYVYFVYFAVTAILIQILEPSINSFGDSLWYCFTVASSVGFGDFTAVTFAGRVLSIILAVYSIAAIAVFTAVITELFISLVKNNAKQSAEYFLDELERLPDLSREELEDLSGRVSRFRNSMKN